MRGVSQAHRGVEIANDGSELTFTLWPIAVGSCLVLVFTCMQAKGGVSRHEWRSAGIHMAKYMRHQVMGTHVLIVYGSVEN